jgi:hypothetical protein
MMLTAETRDGLLLALRNWKKQRQTGRTDPGFLYRLQKAVKNKVIKVKYPAFDDAWAQVFHTLEKKTKRTKKLRKKLEHRQDAVGVDDTKNTRRTKKLEPRRDAARTASYDNSDDYTKDSGEDDDGDEEDLEQDDGDEDDLEQDDGERRNKTVVTNKPRRKRCKRPSSPRTRERHQRAQKMFKLPDGYHHVSESNLLRLLGGTKTTLKPNHPDWSTGRACSDSIRDAYYDTHVREQIDRASFSLLNVYMDDVEAFTYMDSTPDGLHQRLIDLPCIIVCPSNHLGPRPAARPNPLQLHTYCRRCKTLESFKIRVSYAISISVFRPSEEIWLSLFDKDRQRSHLCHNFYCEHPLHSISETPEQNKNRNVCRNHAVRLGKRYDASTAAANTYDDCPHKRPCFSYNAGLITKMDEYIAEAFRLAMRTHGMCKECKLDFPVHLGRTNPRTRESEFYSRHGRTDGCVADDWHSAHWATSI